MKPFVGLLLLGLCVACSPDQKVTRIDLRNRQLDHLPDSVFRYRHATILQAGAGWVSIGPLGNAEVAGANQLPALPDQLCQLTRLQRLGLSYNQIRLLPVCLPQLRRLQSLDLSFNRDLDIRQALPLLLQLPNLTELNLCGVESAFADSTWVKQQLVGRKIKLSITVQDLLTNYAGRR